jgi:hypothetical protein
MITKLFLVALILLSCSAPSEKKVTQDSVAVLIPDSTKADSNFPNFQYSEASKVQTKNFYGYSAYTLTEEGQEKVVWDNIQLLIEQYDTTEWYTLSKNFTEPGTEETPDETLTTSRTETVTLFYDEAGELKAVQKEADYQVGTNGSDKFYGLYLFAGDMIAVYEDRFTALDMYSSQFLRAVASRCPDCGIRLSAGVSSEQVVLAGNVSADDWQQLARKARAFETVVQDYANDYRAYQPNGSAYTYQTEEPLNDEANFDVFYTANKKYYEKFIVPKLNENGN